MSTPLPKRILNSEGFELNRSSSQAAGLVGWWPLGAYPDGRDMSLYANRGVLDNSIDTDVPTAVSYSSTTGVSKVSRRALEFSGTGAGFGSGDTDFITVPHSERYNITGDMTITMWATVNSPAWNTQFYSLLSRNDFSDYTSPYSILWWKNTKKYSLYIGTGSGATQVGTYNNATTYGVWDFITARITGTDMQCFINCISGDGISTFSGSRQTNTRQLRIGGSIYGDTTPGRLGSYNHGGHIDDVRIYKRALSDAEMWTVFRQTLDGGYGDLAAQPTKRLFHFSGIVNLAPTAVALTNKVDSLSEDADTTSATKIADIVVTDDDGEGTNALSVSGTDAASFEVVGTELRLKAGVTLDYETKTSYEVTVEVDDDTVGSTPDVTVSHTLGIINIRDDGHPQADIVGSDVAVEIKDAERGATGRGVSWQPGPAQVVAYGTRSNPSTQAVLDRLDNRFVRGANQGDPVAIA